MKYTTILLILLMIIWTGCSSTIVKHPDAPMLITDSGWKGLRVAIYSKAENKLIDYGWINVPIGLTLIKYDWEKRTNDNHN